MEPPVIPRMVAAIIRRRLTQSSLPTCRPSVHATTTLPNLSASLSWVTCCQKLSILFFLSLYLQITMFRERVGISYKVHLLQVRRLTLLKQPQVNLSLCLIGQDRILFLSLCSKKCHVVIVIGPEQITGLEGWDYF